MQVLLLLALAVPVIPALLYTLWHVHRACDYLCVRHAQRYCRRRGLVTSRVRWRPEFGPSGVKTEFTLVQLDCLDAQSQRKLVTLLVWPLGVRKLVSEEQCPEALDKQWNPDYLFSR